MHNLEFAGTIDITLLLFLTFVGFFLGLVLYLRREDRREGYPLEDDVTGRLEPRSGLFFTARPKIFILPHGLGSVSTQTGERDSLELQAVRTFKSPGSPLEPVGDPLAAGVGPGAFAKRAKRPDLMVSGAPKIVPLRVATDFSIDAKDRDPRGMTVLGADHLPAGLVCDIWVDRMEFLVRYLEVELASPLRLDGPALAKTASGTRRVLLPMAMAVIKKNNICVDAILAGQFIGVPALESPDQITLDEEERVSAYFGGGYLYATAARAEPVI